MKKISYLLIFTVLFASNSFANQDDKIKNITEFVESIGNQIVSVAGDKKLNNKKRQEAIIDLVDKSTDCKWISRFVLGKHYKTITEDQREKFVRLYREFMINTYGPKFNNYNGKSFKVKNVEKQNSFYIAKSEFIPANSDIPVLIDFRVKDNENGMIIVDFIAEGVSLIETQRSEFNSAITEKGIEKFLKDLEKRIEDLKLNNSKIKK